MALSRHITHAITAPPLLNDWACCSHFRAWWTCGASEQSFKERPDIWPRRDFLLSKLWQERRL